MNEHRDPKDLPECLRHLLAFDEKHVTRLYEALLAVWPGNFTTVRVSQNRGDTCATMTFNLHPCHGLAEYGVTVTFPMDIGWHDFGSRIAEALNQGVAGRNRWKTRPTVTAATVGDVLAGLDPYLTLLGKVAAGPEFKEHRCFMVEIGGTENGYKPPSQVRVDLDVQSSPNGLRDIGGYFTGRTLADSAWALYDKLHEPERRERAEAEHRRRQDEVRAQNKSRLDTLNAMFEGVAAGDLLYVPAQRKVCVILGVADKDPYPTDANHAHKLLAYLPLPSGQIKSREIRRTSDMDDMQVIKQGVVLRKLALYVAGLVQKHKVGQRIDARVQRFHGAWMLRLTKGLTLVYQTPTEHPCGCRGYPDHPMMFMGGFGFPFYR